jgi:hypothetical protein
MRTLIVYMLSLAWMEARIIGTGRSLMQKEQEFDIGFDNKGLESFDIKIYKIAYAKDKPVAFRLLLDSGNSEWGKVDQIPLDALMTNIKAETGFDFPSEPFGIALETLQQYRLRLVRYCYADQGNNLPEDCPKEGVDLWMVKMSPSSMLPVNLIFSTVKEKETYKLAFQIKYTGSETPAQLSAKGAYDRLNPELVITWAKQHGKKVLDLTKAESAVKEFKKNNEALIYFDEVSPQTIKTLQRQFTFDFGGPIPKSTKKEFKIELKPVQR